MNTLFDSVESNHKCQGAIFKAEVTNFRTSRGLSFQVKLVKSKKLSCPGCMSCAWQDESFDEVSNDWPISNITEVENNAFYSVDITNVQRDYESGLLDYWDLLLVKFTPPTAP